MAEEKHLTPAKGQPAGTSTRWEQGALVSTTTHPGVAKRPACALPRESSAVGGALSHPG